LLCPCALGVPQTGAQTCAWYFHWPEIKTIDANMKLRTLCTGSNIALCV
jgi:hypothetical protein